MVFCDPLDRFDEIGVEREGLSQLHLHALVGEGGGEREGGVRGRGGEGGGRGKGEREGGRGRGGEGREGKKT